MELVETDTTCELALLRTKDELRAALLENEILYAQVHDLETINEQMRNRLRDLQGLVDTVKRFADDIIAESSE